MNNVQGFQDPDRDIPNNIPLHYFFMFIADAGVPVLDGIQNYDAT